MFSEGESSKETSTLSHSMSQMFVNTPSAKMSKKSDFEASQYGCHILEPLSPPQTADMGQKRERSESLMSYHKNDVQDTKRRHRSRSRLSLDAEKIPSFLMSPPCSSKPRERTYSRSQCQASEEDSWNDPKTWGKYLTANTGSNTAFPTPYSEARQPLQTRDLNTTTGEASFNGSCTLSIEQRHFSATGDYSSDSSSDEDPIECFEDKTRVKLTYDEAEDLDIKTPRRSYNNTNDRQHKGNIIGQRIGVRKIDFIKELVNLNCEEICKKIFCYMEPENLQRVASVSNLWRKICKEDRIASPRLDQFIRGRKLYVMQKGKENLGHLTDFSYKVPQRPPFSVKNSNPIWTPQQKMSSSEQQAIELVKTDIMSTYERMKCPACGSPSRKIGNEICECNKCQEKYCTSCQQRLGKNHKSGKCQLKVNKSKKGKGSEAIGSQKSKRRLKRY